MIAVSRSTSRWIERHRPRASSALGTSASSSSSSSVLRPIDDSGLRTSCVIIAAILPTAASRSERTSSRSRSSTARAHRVELAREVGDLGRAALRDPARVVAGGDPARAVAQPAQRAQRDHDPDRDAQPEHHRGDARGRSSGAGASARSARARGSCSRRGDRAAPRAGSPAAAACAPRCAACRAPRPPSSACASQVSGGPSGGRGRAAGVERRELARPRARGPRCCGRVIANCLGSTSTRRSTSSRILRAAS